MYDILTTLASIAQIASLGIQVGTIPVRSDGSVDSDFLLNKFSSKLKPRSVDSLGDIDKKDLENVLSTLFSINPRVLKEISKRIIECEAKFYRKIRSGSAEAVKLAQIEKKKCVCAFLNILLNETNKGLDAYTKQLWDMNMCTRDS